MSEIRVDSITDEAGTGAPEITDHYKKSNILGTVSESGGVPTGAIIESGSNANGEFVKYADGTMICWHNGTADCDSTSSSGVVVAGSLSAMFLWTFPATFVSDPTPSASADSNEGSTSIEAGIYRFNNGVSQVYVQAFSFGGNKSNVDVRPRAVGRWY